MKARWFARIPLADIKILLESGTVEGGGPGDHTVAIIISFVSLTGGPSVPLCRVNIANIPHRQPPSQHRVRSLHFRPAEWEHLAWSPLLQPVPALEYRQASDVKTGRLWPMPASLAVSCPGLRTACQADSRPRQKDAGKFLNFAQPA